jgi:uncharacterized protein with FMN-binding domain
MIRASKLRLIRRVAGTAAVTAVVAVLVVMYLRSEGAGAVATAPRSSASSGTGAEQAPKSTGSSGGSASSGPGACAPPRICGSQTGASRKVTYTGPVVENPYGPVQVAVAEEGGKVVDVKALQLPTEHAQSQEISEQVAPMLRTEVLQAQNAEINVVSGATYTSESYASSLQGALRQAG